LASYGQAVVLARVGNNLVARYQRRIFDHLMKLDVGFFTTTRSGQLSARIAENVTGIRDLLSQTLTAIARDGVSLIGLLAVMLMQDFVLSPDRAADRAADHLCRQLPDAPAAPRHARSGRGEFPPAGRDAGSDAGHSGGEGVHHGKQLLARRIGVLIDSAEKRANRIASVSERMTPITEMLAGAAIAGVIAYAGYRASVDQQPPGAVISFITALLLAYDPARRLARVQVSLEKSLVNARMIYEILDIKPQQADQARRCRTQGDQGRSALPRRVVRLCAGNAGAAPCQLHSRPPARQPRSSVRRAPASRRLCRCWSIFTTQPAA
jgi:subfamily B ATP-binding cassette protein MsbA